VEAAGLAEAAAAVVAVHVVAGVIVARAAAVEIVIANNSN
jgi:hypothetical protein